METSASVQLAEGETEIVLNGPTYTDLLAKRAPPPAAADVLRDRIATGLVASRRRLPLDRRGSQLPAGGGRHRLEAGLHPAPDDERRVLRVARPGRDPGRADRPGVHRRTARARLRPARLHEHGAQRHARFDDRARRHLPTGLLHVPAHVQARDRAAHQVQGLLDRRRLEAHPDPAGIPPGHRGPLHRHEANRAGRLHQPQSWDGALAASYDEIVARWQDVRLEDYGMARLLEDLRMEPAEAWVDRLVPLHPEDPEPPAEAGPRFRSQNEVLRAELQAMRNSRSWRITRPLRSFRKLGRKS